MIPLMITPEVCARAKEVVAYAKAHVLSTREIELTMQGKKKNVGSNPNHQFDMPCEYNYVDRKGVTTKVARFKVVYSMEFQPCGLCHHISMSIPSNPDRAPHPAAFELVWREVLGIDRSIRDAIAAWPEKVSGGITAINILFLVAGETDIRSPEAETLRDPHPKGYVPPATSRDTDAARMKQDRDSGER